MTRNENTSMLSEQDLEDHVWMAHPRIIVLRGVPDSMSEAIDQLFGRARELAAGIKEPILIASLADAGLPDAAARVRIQQNIQDIGFTEIGVVFQDNVIVRVATRFILASMRFDHARVFMTVDDAVAFFSQDA